MKKAAAEAKKVEAEKRRAEQRERQEEREREREEAEIEAMLKQIPPSVLDGSTAGDNFRTLLQRCATAVAKEHKQFTRALAPLHGATTIASDELFAAWLAGLVDAYAAGHAAMARTIGCSSSSCTARMRVHASCGDGYARCTATQRRRRQRAS